jgi:hypothetical protein
MWPPVEVLADDRRRPVLPAFAQRLVLDLAAVDDQPVRPHLESFVYSQSSRLRYPVRRLILDDARRDAFGEVVAVPAALDDIYAYILGCSAASKVPHNFQTGPMCFSRGQADSSSTSVLAVAGLSAYSSVRWSFLLRRPPWEDPVLLISR